MKNCLFCNTPLRKRKFEAVNAFEKRMTCGRVCAGNLSSKANIARNIEIVADMLSGDYTLEQVGEKYKVTRERIRQIFKRETGMKTIVRRLKIRRIKEQEVLKRKNRVKFHCEAYGKPVRFRENLSKLCRICSRIRRILRRDPRRTHICIYCKKSFHPFANVFRQRGVGKYCSQTCYLKSGNLWKSK